MSAGIVSLNKSRLIDNQLPLQLVPRVSLHQSQVSTLPQLSATLGLLVIDNARRSSPTRRGECTVKQIVTTLLIIND